MSQIIINTGNIANDGTGDPLRTAFNDTNNNFTQIFNAGPVNSNITIANNTIQVTNTNGNLNLATNGIGVIVPATNIVPDIPNVRYLGTATNRFNTVYAQYLDAPSGSYSGNLYVGGNLFVTGTTITTNYDNIGVANLNITLAIDSPNAVLSNNAGIIVHNANANILYNYSANTWKSTLSFTAPAFIGDGSQLTNVNAIVNAVNLVGNVLSTEVNESNLTSFGSVTDISATGNISTTGNVYANIIIGSQVSANFLTGDGSNLTNITASTIVGNVPFAQNASSAYTANLAALATQAINADTALFAINANLAAFANVATSAQTANSSRYAIQADNANSAVVAGMAYELSPNANISVSGNITTSGYFLGNGSQLTGIVAIADYSNANVAAYLPIYSGDVLANDVIANALYMGDVPPSTPGAYYFWANSTSIQMGETAAQGITVNDSGIDIGGTGGVNIYGVNLANVNIGNPTGGYVNITNDVISANSITAPTYFGDGSNLTGLYGNSNVADYLLTYTGDLSANNISIIGNIITTGPQGNITGANVISGITLSASGSVYANNISVLGNINGRLSNGNSGISIAQNGNITMGIGPFATTHLTVDQYGISVFGNIVGNYLYGDGSNITNLPTANLIVNGASYANIPTTGGNLNISIPAVTVSAIVFQGSGYTDGTYTDQATTGGTGTGLTLDYTINLTEVVSASVNNPGTGYLDGDVVTITGGSSNATILISVVNNEWAFNNNGNLTFPQGGYIGPAGVKGDGTMLTGGKGNIASLTSYYANVDALNYSSCVTVNADGTLNITTYGDGTGQLGQWNFSGANLSTAGNIFANSYYAGDYTLFTPGDYFFWANSTSVAMGETAAQGIFVNGDGIGIFSTAGVNISGVSGEHVFLAGDDTGGNVIISSNTVVKAGDDYTSIVFSSDGTTDNGHIKVDSGENMVTNAVSNYYVKQNGSDRLAITDTNTSLMASNNVVIQSNKTVSAYSWTFDDTGNLSAAGNIIATSFELSNAGNGVISTLQQNQNPPFGTEAYGIEMLTTIDGNPNVFSSISAGPDYVALQSTNAGNANITAQGGYGVTITTSDSGGNNIQTWTFEEGGQTQFPGTITAVGNISGAYILGDGGLLSNIAIGNGSPVSTTGNVSGGNLFSTGTISASGNIYASNFIGNLANGASRVSVASSGNVSIGIGPFSTTVLNVNSSTGISVLGNIVASNYVSATGNVYGGNVSAVGNIQGNYVLGNGSLLTGIAASSGEASFTIQSSNFNALTGNRYGVNTTSAVVTATLPATPATGSAVYFADAGGAYATNNLIINPNGLTIMGASGNMTVSTNNQSFGLFYNGTTWRTYSAG